MFGSLTKSIGRAARTLAFRGGASKDAAEADELCVVCLEAPRSALIVPCGHTSTCMECTKRLQPPLCVTCRAPIECARPWRDIR